MNLTKSDSFFSCPQFKQTSFSQSDNPRNQIKMKNRQSDEAGSTNVSDSIESKKGQSSGGYFPYNQQYGYFMLPNNLPYANSGNFWAEMLEQECFKYCW